jgi:8-oxo-dGTP pyrophosphatase MutT (NUDIX family)
MEKLQVLDREVLFDTKWLQVKKAILGDEEGNKVGEYIYQHAPWTKGQGVAILAYRDVELQEEDFPPGDFPGHGIFVREFLGRYELCPAHSTEYELCSTTGGMDVEGESPITTAIRELEEEAGFTTLPEHVIELGTVRQSKSSDGTTHLFAVDIQHCREVEATGDGTVGETGSYMDWVSEEKATFCKDPLVSTMIQRLKCL